MHLKVKHSFIEMAFKISISSFAIGMFAYSVAKKENLVILGLLSFLIFFTFGLSIWTVNCISRFRKVRRNNPKYKTYQVIFSEFYRDMIVGTFIFAGLSGLLHLEFIDYIQFFFSIWFVFVLFGLGEWVAVWTDHQLHEIWGDKKTENHNKGVSAAFFVMSAVVVFLSIYTGRNHHYENKAYHFYHESLPVVLEIPKGSYLADPEAR